MNVEGTGISELYFKDEEGRFHKIHDATNEINEWFSNQKVIDKSQSFFPIQTEFTASLVVDEDRLRMANAKDVTPKGEE